MLGLVFVLAGFVCGGDWLKQVRESSRPLPPDHSPNILFIVLDTVRADRLAFTVTSGRRLPISSDSRSEEFASIMPVRQHPGRWLRTRACSPVTGRTMSVRSGRLRSAETCRCWLNTSGHTVMQPRVLSPMSFIARENQVWPAASLIMKITSWKNWHRCGLSILVEQITTMIAQAINFFDIVPLNPLERLRDSLVCDPSTKGCRVDQPRISRLASPSTRT